VTVQGYDGDVRTPLKTQVVVAAAAAVHVHYHNAGSAGPMPFD